MLVGGTPNPLLDSAANPLLFQKDVFKEAKKSEGIIHKKCDVGRTCFACIGWRAEIGQEVG